MGKREIKIKETVTVQIAQASWFIESKGMIKTAEKFSDEVYDFIGKLSDSRRKFSICRDPERAAFNYKCVVHKKRYTIVFLESEEEIIILEFLPSKLIHW